MEKVFLLLSFIITSIASQGVALSNSPEEEMGVFFCTRDLSPAMHTQIEKGAISSSVFLAASSYLYHATPLPYKIIKLVSGVSGGAMVAKFSSDYLHKLYKDGFPNVQSSMASSGESVTSLSSSGKNFVKVQDKNLNKEDASTYRHCSILIANYRMDKTGDYITVGSHYTQGFFQDPSSSDVLYGKAIESSDPLQVSTVCTKVKYINGKAEYKLLRNSAFEFYTEAVEKQGYNLFSNNCCTVAYAFVKHIGGKEDAIKASNFNHGIGVHLNEGLFSFIVESPGVRFDKNNENVKVDDL